MRGKIFAAFSLASMLPFFRAFGDPISQVNQIVAFGDSLTDSGNLSIASGGIAPGTGYAYRNIPGVPFAVGEYANPPAPAGPSGLWVDQFATKAGLLDPLPYLAGGTNYAVSGAQTGPSFGDVSYQLGVYLTGKTSVPSISLFSFWAGANDIMDSTNPVTAANAAAGNLEVNIATLARERGKYFFWFNLPLLGDTPLGMSHGSATSASWNAASMAFDTDSTKDIASLDKTFPNIVLIPVDIESLFSDILGDPSRYGITNVGSEPKGADLNGYLFSFDGLHPTSYADSLIADLAFTDFEAAIKTSGPPPSTVPEPASGALLLLGLCAIATKKLKAKNRG